MYIPLLIITWPGSKIPTLGDKDIGQLSGTMNSKALFPGGGTTCLMRALLSLLNLTFCIIIEVELVALTGVAAKCIKLSDSCTAGRMPFPLQGRVNVLQQGI